MLYDENEELSTFKRVEPTYSEKYVASDNNKLSVTQFQNDPEVQKQGQIYLEWVAQNQALTPGSIGGYEDLTETLRDEDYRLGDIIGRAAVSKDMPENVKKAYSFLRDTWDTKTESKGFREHMESVADIGTDIIADPLNLLSLIFTGGSGTVASNVVAKESVKATLKRLAVSDSTSDTLIRGAISGATWTGVDDFARQNVEVDANMRDEVSYGQTAGVTALGAGLGAGIGALFVKARGSKDLTEAIDENNIAQARKEYADVDTDDVIDADVETIVSNAEARGVSTNVKDDSSVVLEGDFNVIDDEIVTVSSKAGGGTKTSEELQDTVDEIVSEGGPSSVIKNKILFEIKRMGNTLASKVAFKPASLLDSYTKYSPAAAQLQKKFRYDLGRNIWGDRKYDTQDFNEVYKETAGGYYVDIKTAMEPIQKNVRGDLSKEVNLDLIRALRGAESKDANVNSIAATLRESVLDKLGVELSARGFIDTPVDKYFPRSWDRKALENKPEEFVAKLKKAGEVETDEEGFAVIKEMLDKKNQLDNGSGAGSRFFSKRVFKNIDDNDFEEFLNNDVNTVLIDYAFQASKQLAKKKVFGVKNQTEFENRWLNPIVKEMDQAGKTLSSGDRKNILKLYQTATGEGVSRFESEAVNNTVDIYSTANRLAYLPLATVSSLTEIFINVQKAGLLKTIKGFTSASNTARKTIQTDLFDKLTKQQGLTEPEAWKELNQFAMALDPATGDVAERLAGDALTSGTTRKINNGFFRFTMLDQWTKLVQLTSFTVGKDLITDNLQKIAARGSLKDSRRIKNMRGELNELGVDIDKGLAWIQGGSKQDDPFYKEVMRGASRYTNEVILTPTGESGMKPLWMSSPKTSILFQFMGYPAAFTNTILKNAATAMIKDPVGNVPKTLAAGLIMTEMARWTNYSRSYGKSEENKTEEEIYVEAIKRWGGNGLTADMLSRGRKAAEIYQDPVAYATGFGGPIVQDVYKLGKRGDVVRFLGEKVPFYGALNTVSPELKKDYAAKLKEMDKSFKKAVVPERQEEPYRYFSKGGEVLNVPNAPKEPDQRIDKMTGRPYDQQAGAAFTDQEDRQDPLQRMGFGAGGKVLRQATEAIYDMLSKDLPYIIKTHSNRNVSDDEAKEAAEEIYSNFRGDPDMPSELDDLDFEDFIKLETRALLEEKHDLEDPIVAAQFSKDFPGLKPAGEDFSRARDYTEEAIVNFKMSGKQADLLRELGLESDPQDVTFLLQKILDERKLTQKVPTSKSVRAPKKRGGKVLRSLYANGSKVTTKGRKVYKDKDGQLYSERTETVQLKNGKWVNYPTVDRDGNKIPEELFEKLVESQVTKEGVVDFITGETLPLYNDVNTAVEAAKRRSKSLLNKDK